MYLCYTDSMTTFGALCKIFGFLLKNQKYSKQCLKYEKEGNLAARDEIARVRVPIWAKFVVDMFGGDKTVINVKGVENIPQEGACVFIANHQGYLDIPVILSTCGKQTGFISKVEILKVPMLSSWMKHMECVFMDRKSPRKQVEAMAKAVKAVKAGYSLVIFPEGHRSKDGVFRDFHPGSFKLALRSDAPIVPVTIDGTYHMFEEKGKPQAATVNITYHPAIPTAGLSKEEQAAIPDKVHEIIGSALVERV